MKDKRIDDKSPPVPRIGKPLPLSEEQTLCNLTDAGRSPIHCHFLFLFLLQQYKRYRACSTIQQPSMSSSICVSCPSRLQLTPGISIQHLRAKTCISLCCSTTWVWEAVLGILSLLSRSQVSYHDRIVLLNAPSWSGGRQKPSKDSSDCYTRLIGCQ